MHAKHARTRPHAAAPPSVATFLQCGQQLFISRVHFVGAFVRHPTLPPSLPLPQPFSAMSLPLKKKHLSDNVERPDSFAIEQQRGGETSVRTSNADAQEQLPAPVVNDDDGGGDEELRAVLAPNLEAPTIFVFRGFIAESAAGQADANWFPTSIPARMLKTVRPAMQCNANAMLMT